MTIQDFIKTAVTQLTESGIVTARLDCIVLLEDALQKDRAFILAHTDEAIAAPVIEVLEQQITRRCTHEPLAYIRGRAAFFGRTFTVSHDVLVPRPETEIMIELLLRHTTAIKNPKIADIGTGSGCIGITAKLEIPGSQVDLYDISDKALKVAEQNAQNLSANVHIKLGNLLETITSQYDIILANLPYVPNNFPINLAATHEPKLALFAGMDGLRDYETFWRQAARLTHKPQFILTEAFPSQHHALATMARNSGFVLEDVQDFIQFFAAG